MTDKFDDSARRSIWEERSPRLLGFRIFLENNRCVSWQEAYMAESGVDQLTLIDAIVVWFMYSDGFIWCPRYEDFLDAIVWIAASWDEHDHSAVFHPSAVAEGQVLPLPPGRIDLTAFTSADSSISFAPDVQRLGALLRESTFERLRAVRNR